MAMAWMLRQIRAARDVPPCASVGRRTQLSPGDRTTFRQGHGVSIAQAVAFSRCEVLTCGDCCSCPTGAWVAARSACPHSRVDARADATIPIDRLRSDAGSVGVVERLGHRRRHRFGIRRSRRHSAGFRGRSRGVAAIFSRGRRAREPVPKRWRYTRHQDLDGGYAEYADRATAGSVFRSRTVTTTASCSRRLTSR